MCRACAARRFDAIKDGPTSSTSSFRTGLKETIVLRKPGAPSEYRFRLTPAAGQSWRAETHADGVWLSRAP